MTEESSSLEIRLTAADDVSMLLGAHDKHIKLIEETTETTIHTRGEIIQIIGEQSQINLGLFTNDLNDFSTCMDGCFRCFLDQFYMLVVCT